MNTRVFSNAAMALRRAALVSPLTLAMAMAGDGKSTLLQVDAGVVSFDATTNVSAVTVHGKSAAMKARMRVRQEANKLLVEEVNARLPIDALSTGMGLRDSHMKKYVFTTPEGQAPDLKFTGENLACVVDSGKDATCKFPGKLTIRGVEKPMIVSLKVKADAQGYRAAGDGIVKLSDYGIERPSQFGVKVEDEVKIHLEFQGRETVEASSARLGDAK